MCDRLRVLFAIGSLYGGGSEHQVVNILRRLDRSRFVPFLYLVSRIGELLPHVPADVPIAAFQDRHRPPCFTWPGRIYRMQVRDLAGVLRDWKIDVLYDRTLPMALIAAAAARRAGAARVSAVVSDPRRDLETTATRFARVKRWMLRNAYRRADRVVAVSQGVRDALIDYYRLEPKRVECLPNLLDVARIERLAEEPTAELEPGRFHIVTAGRLAPEKGQQVLLRAIEELVHRRGCESVCLRLLGSGPLEGDLRRFTVQHGLEGHVRFNGFVENPFPLFKQADLFCLPSLYEGSPNALLEAMVCGIPVVASDCASGPREILAGGRLGRLVPPGDELALADAIEDAIIHHDRWRVVARTARSDVAARFSAETGIALLEEVLTAAAASRSKGRRLDVAADRE
jgi:glycosyltransferase involved in cell wall biosynthesis